MASMPFHKRRRSYPCHSVTVRLAHFEMDMAATVGLRRQLNAIRHRRKPRFPEDVPGELWNHHINGACAEYAVCKLLKLPWDGSFDVFDREDIPGTNIDVRYGSPKVKEREARVIVGVLPGATHDEFIVIGWVDAVEVRKHPEWRSRPDPNRPFCWFPPVSAWRPIGQLPLTNREEW